jgi:hypothetical protein
VALAAAGVLALGALHTGVANAADPQTWVVHPGDSIQVAVDKARTGDTVKIDAGTYQEAVCINRKGLKIIGAGRDQTKITWPEWNAIADLPAVNPNPCWTAQEVADFEDDPTTLADNVSGLFFLFPDGPVTVAGLSTRNHPANGVAAWGANGFDVHLTKGVGHERYGVLAADSTKIAITANVEQGVTRPAPVYSGTAGVSVGDSDGARAILTANRVAGYNLGIFVRESRTGSVLGNTLTGNCVGILVFDDSATEIPDTTRSVVGGDWNVAGNSSIANNRYCIAGRDGSQRVSGIGMAVVNADHVVIGLNSIRDNTPVVPAGQEPINFPPGGLVLLGFAPPPGTSPPGAVDPGTVEYVTVAGNTIRNNQPLDVWLTRAVPFSPILDPGPGIVFKANSCGTSDPARICGS